MQFSNGNNLPTVQETDNRRIRKGSHCHITGSYLGTAHNAYNINFKIPKRVAVFFHNLSGYNSHHLKQRTGKYTQEEIKFIETNCEHFISIRWVRNASLTVFGL